MKAMFSVAMMFMIGCAETAPYPSGVRGFLVDKELDVLSLPGGDHGSIRPFVEHVLACNSLPRCIRYSIAQNGQYVACLDVEKKVHVLNLLTGRSIQTLRLPQDCLEVGAISWKPDSGGFLCHIRRAKWNSGQPNSIGEGYILFAEGPDCRWRNLANNITELYGEVSLSRQAWCSNECFVFGDQGVVKIYDLPGRRIKTLTAGFNPAGLSGQKYLFASEHGYWSVYSLGSIEGEGAVRLADGKGVAIINEPVIAPDGNFMVFVNNRFGGNSLAAGIDYALVVYALTQKKYTEMKHLVPSNGFFLFGLDFSGPADAPIIQLLNSAVWVRPLDMDGWRARLSKKTR